MSFPFHDVLLHRLAIGPFRSRRLFLGRTSVALRAPYVLPKNKPTELLLPNYQNNLHRRCYSTRSSPP